MKRASNIVALLLLVIYPSVSAITKPSQKRNPTGNHLRRRQKSINSIYNQIYELGVDKEQADMESTEYYPNAHYDERDDDEYLNHEVYEKEYNEEDKDKDFYFEVEKADLSELPMLLRQQPSYKDDDNVEIHNSVDNANANANVNANEDDDYDDDDGAATAF